MNSFLRQLRFPSLKRLLAYCIELPHFWGHLKCSQVKIMHQFRIWTLDEIYTPKNQCIRAYLVHLCYHKAFFLLFTQYMIYFKLFIYFPMDSLYYSRFDHSRSLQTLISNFHFIRSNLQGYLCHTCSISKVWV